MSNETEIKLLHQVNICMLEILSLKEKVKVLEGKEYKTLCDKCGNHSEPFMACNECDDNYSMFCK